VRTGGAAGQGQGTIARDRSDRLVGVVRAGLAAGQVVAMRDRSRSWGQVGPRDRNGERSCGTGGGRGTGQVVRRDRFKGAVQVANTRGCLQRRVPFRTFEVSPVRTLT
jgi:hypothetical protein